MNQMQREAALYRANKTIICAGRGTGKGLLHAAVQLENFQLMPRSTTAVKHAGFFCMQKQGKTKLFAQANSKIAAYTAYTCLHLYICLYINYLE